jgi:uncharacterized repeat protein (TIGR03803 family)
VGCGTVFKITQDGTLTTLYSFCSQPNCTDGDIPYARLVEGSDGNFYGTTGFGGADLVGCLGGCGTVFKITPGGTLTTLHSFYSTSAADPIAGLIQDEGMLYGTTDLRGAYGWGTVFRITPRGRGNVLHSFDVTDGAHPSALILATDGNLYGTTSLGGTGGGGTIFKITPSGTLTTLYSFCSQSGCSDGELPSGALVQATDGNFYGTTALGGGGPSCGSISGCGTVFRLSVGLGPFVETLPTSGKVGASVKILGTNLSGASSVTLNGTTANFTVVSSSEITATVPTGATSGPVQVTTPKGVLLSNVAFRVRP